MAGDLAYTGPILDSTGFVVVDMQQHYLEAHDSRLVEGVIDAQKVLLGYAMKHSRPVYLLEYDSDRHFYRGSTIPEIADFVYSYSPMVIKKGHNNGFMDTFLARYFRDDGVSHLVYMGVNKSACVYETALAGHRNGFIFSYSEDSVSNRLIWPEVGTQRRAKWDRSLIWLPENAHFHASNATELINNLGR